ncbi:MAG: DegV family protein [Firmicutes bacterium]|nr:DegV family protein [Bacillota bacterium]
MEKIGLLIDSTTLTREEIANYPFVKVAPLGVTIDGIDYIEPDLSTEDMKKYLHTAKKMTTSQPSPGKFLKLYQEYFNEGYTHVLVVTLSEKLSGTYQSAMIAKTMVDFDLEISVHSAKIASFGVALGVNLLSQMIEEGTTFLKLTARYQALFNNTVLMFTLADLMHLFRGGRLSKVQALLGTVLRIKPIVEMIEGKLQLTKKERTNIACYDYFMTFIKDFYEKYDHVYVDIIHMNRIEWAEKMKNEINEKYPKIQLHLTDYVSPVFFVHLGDQGFGIAIVAE